MKSFFVPAAALAAMLPVHPLVAAQAAAAPDLSKRPAPPTPGSAEQAHPDPDQSIVITGVRRPAGDVLGGVSVVDEEALAHLVRPSLGETLQSQPGVTSSSFGPTASRPILRGLSGERVRILTDGIGTLDLSASDPDHAVSINPLTAQRIEVLRGPSALLFGSSAIGGVVNVIDTRIPRAVPDWPVAVKARLAYGSAADERSANLSVDVPLGAHLVAHADGAYSKYDDLRVGGFLLSKPLRRQAVTSSDPDIRALAALKHRLLNSAGRLADAAAGLAYVDGELNVGVSVTHHEARYGVPIRFSLDPAIAPEAPTIDAKQNRADLRVAVPIGGWFKRAELRSGVSRYRHSEIEEDGSIGSRFLSDGSETRAELVQTERGGWGGISGGQYLDQDARIRGQEKYLPDSANRQFGLFTLQTLVRGPLRFEGGLRVEFARLHADEDPDLPGAGGGSGIGAEPITRRFTSLSGSVGGSYEVAPGWRAGLSLSHSERAPAIDELFSFGPHGGSQQFIIGDPGLKKESSNSAELSLRRSTGPVHVQASIYYSRFANFIYQAPTGEIADQLPLYEYRQGKARYYGFEIGADARLGRMLGIDWGAELVADAVRAAIRGFGPAPLIPPLRLLGALTASRGQVDGRLELERVSAQHRTAPNETGTPGFNMVNASVDWHPFAANPELTLTLEGNNLFDVEARRHSSVLKDYAPLGGRDIRLSARIEF